MLKITPVRAAFAFLLTLALTPFCSAQSQLVGEWSGTLDIGGQTARILWHVVKAADGTVTSSYDNVDENVTGIKVKTLTVTGNKVTAVVDSDIQINGQDATVAGTFEGTLSSDGNQIAGTWTQTEPQQAPPADITFKREQAAPAATPAPASPQKALD
ncbi:hypothetical protein DYQ86_20330 [Acidobacteria bacterium AB60]|nr:hypothetical protein DYQ86_20330 [Acidobacteria bacterium AB60]